MVTMAAERFKVSRGMTEQNGSECNSVYGYFGVRLPDKCCLAPLFLLSFGLTKLFQIKLGLS